MFLATILRLFGRRAYIWLFVIAAILRIAFAFRGPELLTERPYQEDSFYAFQTATHVAAGEGFTVDGLHPTNGVQPLIVVLYAPFFFLFASKWMALRATFLLVALIDILSMFLLAALIHKLARKNTPPKLVQTAVVIAAASYGLLYSFMQHSSNGLETGLYSALLLLGLNLYASIRLSHSKVSSSRYALLGSVAGLIILARIDGVFFLFGLILGELWIKEISALDRVKKSLLIGAFAALVSAPWWLYNYSEFGSLMPISGQSEGLADLFAKNLQTTPQALADILTVAFYTPFDSMPIWATSLWFVLAAALVTLVIKRYSIVTTIASKYDLRPLLPLAVAGFFIILFYTFRFSAPHFIGRYFQPIRILWLVVFAIGAAQLVVLAQREKRLRVAITFCLAAGIGFSSWFYMKAFLTTSRTSAYYAGLWARNVAPEKVGMTSSGTASFVSGNVVNLDGKVNYQALQARKQGRIAEYLVADSIRYLADWEPWAKDVADQASALGVPYVKRDSVGSIMIYERE